jgi:uncharacterized protein with GYD domain
MIEAEPHPPPQRRLAHAVLLWTGNYTSEAMRAMVANPSDREAAARKIIEAAGGKLHHMFFVLGSADVMVLTEFPDDVSVAAVSLVTGSAGRSAMPRLQSSSLRPS